jgi:hypothetical protein
MLFGIDFHHNFSPKDKSGALAPYGLRRESELWTNATLPGVRPAARALGYGGPTNMAFLHLTGVVSPEGQPRVNLGTITTGLNVASAQQVQAITGYWSSRRSTWGLA